MRQVTFVVYPGYSVMALAAATVFETANMLQPPGEPLYELRFVSEAGGTVATSAGLPVSTEPFAGAGGDTLVVGGADQPASARLIDFLREAPKSFRRVAAVCVGAFAIAEAGLLDGRRATTHWAYARDLQSRFPAARVDADRIFVQDGPIWTSAGMTAGLDLALALLEEDAGTAAAKSVARKLVLYHRRGGGQSQFSSLLELDPKSDYVQQALVYARAHLHTPLSVPQLAKAVHLSPRQFSRVFQAETGESPAKAIEKLRVEMARSLLEHSVHSMETVARETGFSDRDHMRRAFLRAFGQPPQSLRRSVRNDSTESSSQA